MKNATDKGLGVGLIALLGIGCCVALPLLAAASISVAALAWDGTAVGTIVAVVVFSIVLFRRRARVEPAATGVGTRARP